MTFPVKVSFHCKSMFAPVAKWLAQRPPEKEPIHKLLAKSYFLSGNHCVSPFQSFATK